MRQMCKATYIQQCFYRKAAPSPVVALEAIAAAPDWDLHVHAYKQRSARHAVVIYG